MNDRNRRERLLRWTMCAVLAVVLAVPSVAAAADAVQLRFATVGIGSAWYNYGAGIADLVKPNLPKGSTVDVLPIAGTVGNMKLLQSGETELGLSFPNVAAEGCGGFGSFDKKTDKVRGLMGGLDTYYYGTFVTVKSGINSWDELAAGKARMTTTRGRFRRVGPAPDPRALWKQQEGRGREGRLRQVIEAAGHGRRHRRRQGR